MRALSLLLFAVTAAAAILGVRGWAYLSTYHPPSCARDTTHGRILVYGSRGC